MIAVDTNVVVRLLTGDDVRQAEHATELFRRNSVFIGKTVLLEVEWVLRRGYRQLAKSINHGLDSLIGLPNVTCEDEPIVRRALAWHRAGMDFADALHVAGAPPNADFLTFDRDLVKAGKRLDLFVSLLR